MGLIHVYLKFHSLSDDVCDSALSYLCGQL